MNKDKAQDVAEKITSLSLALFEIALQSSNIITALHLIQDSIKESADNVNDILKVLPPEVQERLRVMKSGDVASSKDALGFADWVRNILKGGLS